MTHTKPHLEGGRGHDRRALGLALLAFACWAVMFMAGTDVWHDLGRPDIWRADAPWAFDLRAHVFAFYALFVALAAQIALAATSFARSGRNRRAGESLS